MATSRTTEKPNGSVAEYSLTYEGATVHLAGDGDRLTFTASHPSLIDRDSAVFAVWALLPIAMKKNRSVRIDGGGDELTIRNAESLSRIWATWLPHKFRQVYVSFSRSYSPERAPSDTELMLYSGGVDSCYNLLRRHEKGQRQSLLTIHGLDYKPQDQERFQKLVEKTDPLCFETGSDRLFLRTNIYSEYNRHGIGADISHGFALAASLFLYSQHFRAGEISADYSREQEFLAFPWGTNSVTNEYFGSRSFKMKTADLDVTRAQKMNKLFSSPTALGSLSFCKDYFHRPHNCGICSKCLRTKAMFIAECGEVPDVFTDRSVRHGLLDAIDLGKRSELAFFADLLESAERTGFIDDIPGLRDKGKIFRAAPSKSPLRFIAKAGRSLEKRTRPYLRA